MRINRTPRQIMLLALIATMVGLAGLFYLYQQGAASRIMLPLELEETIDGTKVESFSIKTDIANTTFIPSETNELKIRLTGEITKADLPYAKIRLEELGGNVNVTAKTTRGFQIGIDVTRIFHFFSNKLQLVIELPDKTYNTLKAETDTGDLALHAIRADKLELISDTGTITLKSFAGSKLIAETDTGNLHLGLVSAAVDLESDTGNISLNLEDFPANSSLKTDTGDIQITLAKTIPLKVDFATDTGRLEVPDADFAASTRERRKISGQLANGGPLLYARSDTGDIKLSTR